MNWKKKFAAITATLATLTLTMHAINRIIHYFATSKDKLTDQNGNYFEWRFGNIYYEKHGNGSPVLLIHDTRVYSSSEEWKHIIETLSKSNTVYTLDLLGCGRSEKPLITYTNFLYVQLISDFIKQIIGNKTDVITSGSSISIATMTALYNPDIIDNIIVSNPESINKIAVNPNNRSKIRKQILLTPILGTFIYNVYKNKYSLTKELKSTVFGNTQTLNDDLIQMYYESIHKGHTKSKYVYASIIGRYTNVNIINSLKNINNSIYIITNSENTEKINTQYKELMPSIEIITLYNTDGYSHLVNPVEFLEQVNFLLEADK